MDWETIDTAPFGHDLEISMIEGARFMLWSFLAVELRSDGPMG